MYTFLSQPILFRGSGKYTWSYTQGAFVKVTARMAKIAARRRCAVYTICLSDLQEGA
jgi:hypothetical protein